MHDEEVVVLLRLLLVVPPKVPRWLLASLPASLRLRLLLSVSV